jgi:hypothetical protein
MVLTFFTAFKTPFLNKPSHRHVIPLLILQLKLQMEPALPKIPCSVTTSTSIVGFPLESKICLVNFDNNTHTTFILNFKTQIYSIL